MSKVSAKTNRIGLSKDKSKNLSKLLNDLLSNYQVFYMNTRGYHWNIKGDNFFELHLKFEEFYTDFQIKIDEIAERILTLGHTPLHSFTDYLKHSSIKEDINSFVGKESLSSVLNSFEKLIQLQREILAVASEAEDEGTNALMSDYIRLQEKTIWMLTAYLNK
jgi:starvation-inducible DNA-binding protein